MCPLCFRSNVRCCVQTVCCLSEGLHAGNRLHLCRFDFVADACLSLISITILFFIISALVRKIIAFNYCSAWTFILLLLDVLLIWCTITLRSQNRRISSKLNSSQFNYILLLLHCCHKWAFVHKWLLVSIWIIIYSWIGWQIIFIKLRLFLHSSLVRYWRKCKLWNSLLSNFWGQIFEHDNVSLFIFIVLDGILEVTASEICV